MTKPKSIEDEVARIIKEDCKIRLTIGDSRRVSKAITALIRRKIEETRKDSLKYITKEKAMEYCAKHSIDHSFVLVFGENSKISNKGER